MPKCNCESIVKAAQDFELKPKEFFKQSLDAFLNNGNFEKFGLSLIFCMVFERII